MSDRPLSTDQNDDPVADMERSIATGIRRGWGTVVGDLTKRELFAAMMMQGTIAADAPYGSFEECARSSIAAADALLKELAK